MSFEIIDGSKPFSAKYIYQPPPDFHLSKHPEVEAQRYYQAQKEIWADGYFRDGVKILSGKHYFYLQEIFLKTGKGQIIRPHWKDCDDLVFNTIDNCIDNGKDLFILKRREIGLTSMIAGGLLFWYARMFPGATFNVTSADKKRFIRMFEDKIVVAYERMSPWIMNCKPKNINRSKGDAYLKIELQTIRDDGVADTVYSELNLLETSQSDDSVTNFSSSRTPLMFVDEIFLHPRVNKLLRSSEATRMDGTEKFGFFIGGGTCEETVTQEELKEFQNLWIHGGKKGIERLFLPAWMGLRQCSTNGWSDEKAGTDWVLSQLEIKEQSPDPNDALAWRKNYPLTEDDIWDLAKGDSYFEQDVADSLSNTLDNLIEKGSPEAPYKFIHIAGEVEATPDPKRRTDDGGLWIVETPVDGQKYYQCIDGAASGKLDGAEEGSWIASIIFKDISLTGDHYAPVCIYFERPNRLEDGYRNMVFQYKLYNKFGGMVHINYETNAGMGGNYGTYLDNNGLFKAIMRRKDMTGKGNIDTNKLGTAVDDNVLVELKRRGDIFLRRHGSSIRSKLMLNQLLMAKDENADIRSAFLIFMASIKDWDKPKKKNKEQRYRTVLKLVKNANGQMEYKSTKIPISNENIHPADMDELATFQTQMEKKYGSAYWYQKSNFEERERYKSLKTQ